MRGAEGSAAGGDGGTRAGCPHHHCRREGAWRESSHRLVTRSSLAQASGELPRASEPAPEAGRWGAQSQRTPRGCWEVCPAGPSPPITEVCPGAAVAQALRAPGSRRVSLPACLPFVGSLIRSSCRPSRHSYRPAEGCRGELGDQHVEQGLAGAGRGQRLQGDGAGAGVGVSLHIRFSHVPVVLVPLCLRGQMRLCASDGHTSWLLVWRVQCPLLWQSGPGAPHRAGVWVLFQEPARSHPALTPAQESSNKSPCAHVCPGVWTLSWGVPLAPLTLAPWPGDT